MTADYAQYPLREVHERFPNISKRTILYFVNQGVVTPAKNSSTPGVDRLFSEKNCQQIAILYALYEIGIPASKLKKIRMLWEDDVNGLGKAVSTMMDSWFSLNKRCTPIEPAYITINDPLDRLLIHGSKARYYESLTTHRLSDGDKVTFSGIDSMPEINGKTFKMEITNE